MEAPDGPPRGWLVHWARTIAVAVAAEAGTKPQSNFKKGEAMQPWKISVGLTAIILALALMLAGESFAYLTPYFRIILTDYWMPIAWYGGLALA